MPHATPLLTTLVAALCLGLLLGGLALRLRLSPIVGYLLAGFLIGPHTPGFTADPKLAAELAEIGVILLMFGVGLHFSIHELSAVRGTALPGALGQIAVATCLGMGLGHLLGWPWAEGMVFGLALSVASTVVLLRALAERHLLRRRSGRIAIGWLITEDLFTVLVLVLLPVLAPILAESSSGPVDLLALAEVLGIALLRLALFLALMLVVARRVLPVFLDQIAATGSRELFRLGILAMALGIAYAAAHWFGASFALGAFFAGTILAGSPLAQQAAEESLPMRDAFAVLFFVSVGMLVDARILLEMPLAVAATVGIIILGKAAAAYAITRALGHPPRTGLAISASLAQIGEFSFILAELGVRLDLLSEQGRGLILCGALISILLNPLVFRLALLLRARLAGVEAGALPLAESALAPVSLSGHAVVVGYGRVGRVVVEALLARNTAVAVVEEDVAAAQAARAAGLPILLGSGTEAGVLLAAALPEARHLFICVPDGFMAGQIATQARALSPSLSITARVHSVAETRHLLEHGADRCVDGERETALGMIEATPGFRL